MWYYFVVVVFFGFCCCCVLFCFVCYFKVSVHARKDKGTKDKLANRREVNRKKETKTQA